MYYRVGVRKVENLWGKGIMFWAEEAAGGEGLWQEGVRLWYSERRGVGGGGIREKNGVRGVSGVMDGLVGHCKEFTLYSEIGRHCTCGQIDL